MASKTFTQSLKLYKNSINQNKNKFHKNILNYILIVFIVIVLPKQIFSDNPYIEIEVNKNGLIQILSSSYGGIFPNHVYVNDVPKTLSSSGYIDVDSIDYKIKLEWNSRLVNFRYMFSSLQSITHVYMYFR